MTVEVDNAKRPASTVSTLLWCCYGLILAAILVWACIIRFQLPQLPLADNDTPGYINPALSKLVGLGYIHDHGRHFVYPGLVYVLLKLFGDFRALAVFQHILGVLTGIFMVLTWERAIVLWRSPSAILWFLRALGLVMAATFLTATKPIYEEMQIRPESAFFFSAILSLYLNIEFIRNRFVDYQQNKALLLGVLSLFVAVLLHCLRPAWGFGIGFASLPVLISVFDRSESIARKALLFGTAAAVILLLLILPERALAREDREAKTFGARVVFAVHADMIRDQIGADLAGSEVLPYPREWLAEIQKAIANDIQKTAKTGQRTLGFDSDFIMWRDSAFNKIDVDLRRDPDKIAEFCWYYYKRTVLQQPGRMTKKVLRQLSEFYDVPSTVYQKRESWPFPLAESYVGSASDIGGTNRPEPWEGILSYLADVEQLKTTKAAIPANRWLSPLHLALAYSYLPCLITTVVATIVILALPDWRRRFGVLALFALLAYSYSFGNCLTVAAVHILEVRRFRFVQLAFVMLSQFLTFALIIQLVAHGFTLLLGRFSPTELPAKGN